MSIGLFCVHGFLEDGQTSFQYLIERLERYGIQEYYTPNLQGHGPNEKIETFNYKLCLDQVEKEYIKYASEFDQMYIIGFSMGGVIAAHLASKFGCEKLVMVSPAFKYGNQLQVVTDFGEMLKGAIESEQFPSIRTLLKHDHQTRKEIIHDYVNREFMDRGASYENFLDRLSRIKPIMFLNFTRLVSTVRRQLKFDEKMSARIYQAEKDELIPVSGSLYILHKIPSRNKRLIVLSGVRHRILSAPTVRDEIIEEIIQYLYR